MSVTTDEDFLLLSKNIDALPEYIVGEREGRTMFPSGTMYGCLLLAIKDRCYGNANREWWDICDDLSLVNQR